MNILRLKKNVLIALLLVSGFLFSGTVFAADEAMTLGAGTKGAGPILYLSFDDSGGPSAHDKSGNSNDGTLNAGATGSNTSASQMWTPAGKFGGAIEFDGDDYILISDSTFDYSTFTAWFKTNTNTLQVIGAGFLGSAYYTLCVINGKLTIAGSGGSVEKVQTSESVVSTGQWHHVVVVDTGESYPDEFKIYLDGDEKALVAGGEHRGAGKAIIGARYYAGVYSLNFDGIIDEVKVYNRIFSADDVFMEYNAGAAAHLGSTTSASYDPWGGDPPIAWWSMDENSGVDTYDRSGSGNDGSITGATWAQGKYGPALSFDGNDNVNCGNNTSLTPASITIEGWVNLNNWASRHVMLAKWSGYTLEINSNATIAFGLSGVTGASSPYYNSSPSTITWNEWHHLVCTWDDTTKGIAIYIDGQKVKSDTLSGSISHSTSSLIMGWSFNELNGLIDDVKIYNYARTQAQVAWDYNKGKPVGWWKMDEGSGTTVKDSSGNGMDGTLYPTAVSWETGSNPVYGNCVLVNDVGLTWQSIRVSDNPILGGMPQLSVSLWLQMVESKTTHQVIYKRQGGGTPAWHSYRINMSSSKARFYVVNSSGTSVIAESDSALELNKWYHLEGVYDGSQVQIYVDGVAADSSPPALTGSVLDSDGTLQIGGLDTPETYFTHGYIDDVKIYNYARTTDQIMQDYLEGAAVHLGD